MNPPNSTSHSITTSAFGAAAAIVVAWTVGAVTGHAIPTDVTMALGVVLTGCTSFALNFLPTKGTP